MKWFWLSFGDPKTGKWLGGCWVEALTAHGAIQSSHDEGLNPGGEVSVMQLGKGDSRPLAEQLGRLLQKSDFPEGELEQYDPRQI